MDIIYYVAASVDGFIATPDGGIEWLAPFETAGEDYGYAAFYDSIEAVLMGSRTYEQILGFDDFPYPDKPVLVFTKRKLNVPWPGIALTGEHPRAATRELEHRGIQRAWLVGGGALAGSFREAGLISEYIISVIPAILGAGIPLFGSPGKMETLTLTGSHAYPNGVVQNRYAAFPA